MLVIGSLANEGFFTIQIEGGKRNNSGLQIDITGRGRFGNFSWAVVPESGRQLGGICACNGADLVRFVKCKIVWAFCNQ